MPDVYPRLQATADRRSYRSPPWIGLAVVAVAAALLVVPALARVPARLVEGCGTWIAAAGVSELLSVLGFVVVFRLVFAEPLSWRRSAPAALRALAAVTILPAGGLVGPAIGAWSAVGQKPSPSRLARSMVTFVMITAAPGVIVLVTLGTLLWLGFPSGPHETALTLLPAVLAGGVLTVAWLAARSEERRRSACRVRPARRLGNPLGTLRGGVTEARALVIAGSWKLAGAVVYYAFDNAVLWAAFHAYGRVPPLGVVVMGYLVGSLAAALPMPAGLGAVDGGLIGALVLYGAPAGRAAAAVLLYRGISLLVPVVLGALAWTCGPARLPLRANARRAVLSGLPQSAGRFPQGGRHSG